MEHFTENLDDQLWSKVFHPQYGPCSMFDISNINKYKYIPYHRFIRPGIDFILSENFPFQKLRISLHTKYDFPDAELLNGRLDLHMNWLSNETKNAYKISVRKTKGKRQSTRKKTL